MKNTYIIIIFIVLFALFLFQALIALPQFGFWQDKDVAKWYLQYGLPSTGSANVINAVIWDFRAFDTLGEKIVLIAAALSVFLIARRRD